MEKKTKKLSKKSSLEDRFVDLLDLDTPTIITLYGRPGTGKTTIACTGPKPLLLIDVKDKGTDSGKREDLEPGDITVFELENFDEIYEVYDYIQDNPERFKSVVIDHMTALQDFCYQKVMDEEGKSKMSQGMYGTAGSYLKEVINLYKGLTDLGITPIFNCQDRMESGDGEGEDQLLPEVGPGLMPSVARTLCAASRVIGHTYQFENVEKLDGAKVRRNIEFRLRLGPNPYYITKVTRPVGTPCPMFLVDASYNDIMKIVKGRWRNHNTVKKKGSQVKKKLGNK
nr:MAG TPA: AAA domain protein [Caudoviricetes sp.]